MRRFREQPLGLGLGPAPEFLLLRLHPLLQLSERLRAHPASLSGEPGQHMEIVVIAERLAQLVQGFGLRVQRFRPRGGEKRELVAQVDDAGAKRVQRRGVGALEGAAPAPPRLPVGARRGGDDLVLADARSSPIPRRAS